MKASSVELLDRLANRRPKLIDLSLERVLTLLERLGAPQRRMPPVIHVAGTNGKGSTIAFLKAMLEANGQSVHAYTSPHLVSFHERIYIGAKGGGAPISDGHLAEVLHAADEAAGDLEITYFEVTTAAAFLAFADSPADIALIEVGLGGRLDATNVFDAPAATVITPVDLDHQSFLGETFEEIASEKAGILKPGAPAIVGPQNEAAYATIATRAGEVGAPLFAAGRDWVVYQEHGRLVYQDQEGLIEAPPPGLRGRHQIENAGLAIATLRAAQLFPGPEAVATGVRAAQWPGRVQRLKEGSLFEAGRNILGVAPDLWIDGGHNPHGARALAEAMAEIGERAPAPLHLICAMQETKDAHGVFAAFTGLAASVSTVPMPTLNGFAADTLAKAAEEAGLPAKAFESIDAAATAIWRDAKENEPPRVLVCGSLYLIGEILKEIKLQRPQSPPAPHSAS